MREANLFSLIEAELRIAETIRTTKGSYSEVLLLSSRQSSVFRFYPHGGGKSRLYDPSA